MQIEIVYLSNLERPQEPQWVLLQIGASENGVIHHGSGVTVKTTDKALTLEAVGQAETQARHLGLHKFYVEGA